MNEYIFKLSDVPNHDKAEIFYGHGISNFMIIAIILMTVLCGISFIRENCVFLKFTPLTTAVSLSLSFLVLAVFTQYQTNKDLREEIPLELYEEMSVMSRTQNAELINMISSSKADKAVSYMEYYIIKNKYNSYIAERNQIKMNQILVDTKEDFLK